MRTRLLVAAATAVTLMTLGTGTAFASEITGNGQLKDVHGNSPCAYSGQEDLQWFTTDEDITRVQTFVRGEPSHSQNWGHVKRELGLTGGANSVPLIEWGCNGHDFGLK